MTVAGTRPELIKLLPMLRALRAAPDVHSIFCHSGQHADLGREVLDVANIAPDEMLSRPAGTDTARLLSGMVTTLGAAMDRNEAELVVVQGDTATTLAGTLAAFHRGIPVAHVEAGLRSGDLARPFPEEGYRRMIGQIAQWHFAPTPAAADALRREGVAEGKIEVVGNTVIDALNWASARLDDDPALGAEAEELIAGCEGRALVLATAHRRETDRAAMQAVAAGLRALTESENVEVILPLHPRSESDVLRDTLEGVPRISLIPPLGYFAFIRLMRAARLIVSDSGGIQEEATALGRPVLVLREVTERAEAIAVGTARLVGRDPESLVAGARWALAREMPAPDAVFGDGKAGDRIAAALIGALNPGS